MRRFYLENEYGERFNFQNADSAIFETVSGLGITYTSDYSKIGNHFVTNSRGRNQQTVSGTLDFVKDPYSNFEKFTSFVSNAKSLSLVYVPKNKEYFLDIDLNILDKGEMNQQGILQCPISLTAKTPYYSRKKTNYITHAVEGESRWPAKWDFKFADITTAQIDVTNSGELPASFDFTIYGPVLNPLVEIYSSGKLINKIPISVDLKEDEKLFYSSVESNQCIQKIDKEGKITNIFNSLDLNNDNFFKIKPGNSTFYFKKDISKVELTIYEEWNLV